MVTGFGRRSTGGVEGSHNMEKTVSKWNAYAAMNRGPYIGEHDGISWQEAAARVYELGIAASNCAAEVVKAHLIAITPALKMMPPA